MGKRGLPSNDLTELWNSKQLKYSEEESEEEWEDCYWDEDGNFWVWWSGDWWLPQENGYWQKWRGPTQDSSTGGTAEEGQTTQNIDQDSLQELESMVAILSIDEVGQ